MVVWPWFLRRKGLDYDFPKKIFKVRNFKMEMKNDEKR